MNSGSAADDLDPGIIIWYWWSHGTVTDCTTFRTEVQDTSPHWETNCCLFCAALCLFQQGNKGQGGCLYDSQCSVGKQSRRLSTCHFNMLMHAGCHEWRFSPIAKRKNNWRKPVEVSADMNTKKCIC